MPGEADPALALQIHQAGHPSETAFSSEKGASCLSAGAYEQPRVRGTAHDVEPTGSDAGPGKTTASRSAARGRRSLRAKPQLSLTHTGNLSAGAHEQPCGSGTAHDIEPKGSDAGRDKTKASRRAAKKRRPARTKALDWSSELEGQAQVPSPSPPGSPQHATRLKHRLHLFNAKGKRLAVPGAQERDGQMFYCSSVLGRGRSHHDLVHHL